MGGTYHFDKTNSHVSCEHKFMYQIFSFYKGFFLLKKDSFDYLWLPKNFFKLDFYLKKPRKVRIEIKFHCIKKYCEN